MNFSDAMTTAVFITLALIVIVEGFNCRRPPE